MILIGSNFFEQMRKTNNNSTFTWIFSSYTFKYFSRIEI